MRKLLKKLSNQTGMTLIDVMLAMGISSIVAFSLLSTIYQSGKLQSGNHTRTSLQAARQNLQRVLSRYDNLQLTVANNSSFDCLFAPNPACGAEPTADGFPFDLYDRYGGSARKIYDSTSTTQGLFPDGAFRHNDPGTGDDSLVCVNSGDPAAPSAKCPIRVVLTWKPVCGNPGCNPALIRIIAKFKVFRKDLGVTGSSSDIASSYNIDMISSVFTDCKTPWDAIIANGASVTAFQNETGSCATSETRTCSRGILSGSYNYEACGCLAPWGTLIAEGASVAVWNHSTPPVSTLCSSVTQTCQVDGTLTPVSTNTHESCTNRGCTDLPWAGTNGTIAHGASVTAYSAANHATNCALIAQTRTCTSGVLSGTNTFQACSLTGTCAAPWNAPIIVGASVTAYQAARQSPACVSETRDCVAGPTLTGSYTYSSCTPCAGYLDPTTNVCWYLGAANEDCVDVCNTHGGTVANYINEVGSGGSATATKCKALLTATGAPAGLYKPDDTCTTGYGCHYDGSASQPWRRCATPATSSTVNSTFIRRLCSCAL